MSEYDEKARQVGNLLSDVLATELVTGWTVVAEAIGEDGVPSIWTLHSDGSNAWDILGRLTWSVEYLKSTEFGESR